MQGLVSFWFGSHRPTVAHQIICHISATLSVHILRTFALSCLLLHVLVVHLLLLLLLGEQLEGCRLLGKIFVRGLWCLLLLSIPLLILLLLLLRKAKTISEIAFHQMAIDSVMVYHLIEEVGEDDQQEDVEDEGGDEGEKPVVRLLRLGRPPLHLHLLRHQIIGKANKTKVILHHLIDEAAEEVDDDGQQGPVVDDEVDEDEDEEEKPDDAAADDDYDDGNADDDDDKVYEDEEEKPLGVLLSVGHGCLPHLRDIKRGASCFQPHRSHRLKKTRR